MVCILKYRSVLSCNGVYFEVSYRIDTYRRVSGTASIDCFDQYRACIEWASGTVTYRYVSGMYRKGQIGCVENGHVFTVFTRIERAKSCVRRKRLYCHVSCMSRTGPNWGAGIHMYREVSIETIRIVYRIRVSWAKVDTRLQNMRNT